MPIEEALAVRAARRQTLQTELAALLGAWPSEFTLEIGSGHGHFLTAYADAHPGEYCLGIDIILDRLLRAGRKATRTKAGHVRFLRAEAGLFLETLPDTHRVKRVFVLFPDPWPKRRHHKNRLLAPAFLDLLSTKAVPDCRLYFRTDYEPYFEAAVAAVHDHPTWQLIKEPWPFEHPTVFQARVAIYYSFVAVLRPVFMGAPKAQPNG